MITSTRRSVLGAALLAGAVSPVRAQPRKPVSLRIAYLKSTSDLVLVRARGELEPALTAVGVQVQWAGPFTAAAPAIEALAAGAVDMTIGSSTAFVTARAAGVEMAMFGYQRLSAAGECIIVKSASPVSGLADLAGRSVAVNRGGTGEYILVRALEKAKMPLDAVRRVYLSPPDAQAAFASGAVDGWAIWDPFLSIALEAGDARVLADGAQCGSENAVAYFVSRAFLAAHRVVVQTMLAVLETENDWARAHPDEAGAIWAKELGLPASLGPRLGQNNTPRLGSVNAAAAAQIEHIADWYVTNRIIPDRPVIAPYLADLAATKI